MSPNSTDTLFEALVSTTASFLILLILTRALGKKQMSQLTFFNYITGITIGSIAGNIITLEGRDFFKEISTLVWWCFLTYLVDFVVLKIPKARELLDGQPSILIKKGKIQYKELKKNRIDIDNMISLLRAKDVFSITEVDYAILEQTGELTVLKKQDMQNTIKKDLNIKLEENLYMPTEVISNGIIIKKNLKELNLSFDWLYEQLHNKGIENINDVLYAELQSNGSLYIDEKSKK